MFYIALKILTTEKEMDKIELNCPQLVNFSPVVVVVRSWPNAAASILRGPRRLLAPSSRHVLVEPTTTATTAELTRDRILDRRGRGGVWTWWWQQRRRTRLEDIYYYFYYQGNQMT